MKSNHRTAFREWGLLLMLGIILLLVLQFGIVYHTEFERNLTEKYRQQLTGTAAMARQGILGFFEKFSQNLVQLSHNPDIIHLAHTDAAASDDPGTDAMRSLYKVHRHEVDALILMDTAAGVVRRIAADTITPHFMMCIGNPLANPPVPADSVYVSDVFMNHRNEKSVTISCPVYENGIKTGILRWMVTIESISRSFAGQTQDNPGIGHIILDDEGRLLTGEASYHGWLCRNLCKCGNIKLPVPLIDGYGELSEKGSGKIRLLPLGCEVYAAWDGFLAGRHPWKMVVMIPAGELDQAMWKHGLITYGMTALILIILLLMAWSFFSVRMKKAKLETDTRYLSQLAEANRLLSAEKEDRLLAQIGGQETERERISRELHDGLGQGLLALRLKFKSLLAKKDPGTDELVGMELLLDEIVEDIRRISADLAPSGLYELGISKALEHYCKQLSERTGVAVEYVSFSMPHIEDDRIRIHLFRIAQEALSNALRHSGATEINVQLLGRKGKITLLIQDNGKGFVPDISPSPAGNGLRNIRDRVSILKGELLIDTAPGEGCTIHIKIPVQNG
ncbi:MAG TPA: histidine kinase [Bacteroidales bacterium]|nr:histidine kinase [Bacteroidales bacterium]HRZ50320.1 histidine kinase [Bacteroidales bacterium]